MFFNYSGSLESKGMFGFYFRFVGLSSFVFFLFDYFLIIGKSLGLVGEETEYAFLGLRSFEVDSLHLFKFFSVSEG